MIKTRQKRCNATTRTGTQCRKYCVRDKARCRLHGGAAGSGAPAGNRNALKHGRRTRAAREEARRLREVYERLREGVAGMN